MTRLLCMIVVMAGAVGAPRMAEAVPAGMPVQGTLTSADGTAVEGSQVVRFRIYDAASGGNVLHEESMTLMLEKGAFAAYLGKAAPLPFATFTGSEVWLGITVGTDAEMTPRFEIGTVPFAARAQVCESVGDLAAGDVQHKLTSGCAPGAAIRDITADGVVTCEPVAGGIPSGAIMFFDVACPPGWSAYAALTGRVPVGATASIGTAVGTQLGNLGTRTINQVPAHAHTVDPPSTATTSVGTHTHGVDPPSFTTGAGGAHNHTIENPGAGGGTSWRVHWAGTTDQNAGDVSIPSLDSQHAHSINVPRTVSEEAGAHGHSVDIASFNSGTTGSTTVDVTMPYLQLRVCRKD